MANKKDEESRRRKFNLAVAKAIEDLARRIRQKRVHVDTVNIETPTETVGYDTLTTAKTMAPSGEVILTFKYLNLPKSAAKKRNDR